MSKDGWVKLEKCCGEWPRMENAPSKKIRYTCRLCGNTADDTLQWNANAKPTDKEGA